MKKCFLRLVIVISGGMACSVLQAASIYEPYAISTVAGWGDNSRTVDGPPDEAQFNDPTGLAIDQEGNAYVAEFFGQTIRKIDRNGFATTFAGKAGESGSADGRGANARFTFPVGVAVGPGGAVYVADLYNQTIRKISRRGVVTTLAGLPGIAGFVDGVGSEARFNSPIALAVNKAGEVFVADSGNFAVRKITPDGTVTTFAGGTAGSQDGKGTEASFNAPYDIAIDKLENLYVVENYFNFDLRKITPDAVVTTIARGLGFPDGVAVDRELNIYVADGDSINRFTPEGVMSSFVGGISGSEDGVGVEAQFASPFRIAFDRSGNLFTTDSRPFYGLYPNNTIRKITPETVVTTFCGVADRGSRDGVGTEARLFWPRGVASDGAGTLLVADSYNNTIRKITPDGTVTTIAGKVRTPGYVDGTGSDARFNNPSAVALDTSGNLYVADTTNNVIRKVTPAGEVSTVAGGYDFSQPTGVAVDAAGNVYVAVTENHTIDKIDLAGHVTVLAGSPGHHGYADGTGRAALFDDPSGVALDGAGNIYVADKDNNAIRKITPERVVTTLAGQKRPGSNDGVGSEARFTDPIGVAVDAAGNVYVTDNTNSTLRKVTPSGSTTTLAGRPGEPGWVDDTGAAARFRYPFGIAVDADGTLYVADVYNQTIRKGVAAP